MFVWEQCTTKLELFLLMRWNKPNLFKFGLSTQLSSNMFFPLQKKFNLRTSRRLSIFDNLTDREKQMFVYMLRKLAKQLREINPFLVQIECELEKMSKSEQTQAELVYKAGIFKIFLSYEKKMFEISIHQALAITQKLTQHLLEIAFI